MKQLQEHTGIQQLLRPPAADAQMCGHCGRAQGPRGLGQKVKHAQLTGSEENLGAAAETKGGFIL